MLKTPSGYLTGKFHTPYIYLLLGIASSGAIIALFPNGLIVCAGIAVLLLVFLMLAFPLQGISLLLMARPFLELFTNYSLFGSSLAENLNPAGIVAFILVVCTYIVMFWNRKTFKLTPIVIYYILFLAFSSVSIFIASNLSAAVGELIRYISFLCVFLLVQRFAVNINHTKILLVTIVLSSVVPLVYAYYQVITGNSKIVLNVQQITSFFPHQNNLAHYLVLIISISIVLSFLLNSKVARVLCVIYIFLCLLVMIKTYSRSGWLGLAVALGIIGWFSNKKLLFGFMGFAVLVWLVDPFVGIRIQYLWTSSIETNSLLSRLLLWDTALLLFKRSPIIGIGLKSFNEILNELGLLLNTRGTSFHNLFLQILTETGILGFSSFILFKLQMIILAVKKFDDSRSGPEKIISVGFLGLLFGILVIELLDNVFSPLLQWPLWAYMGIVANLSSRRRI